MTYLIYCCEVHRLWTVAWWRHCPFCFLAKCYLWNTCCITLNESDNDNWSVFWLRLLISYSIKLVDCKTNGVLRKHSKNHDSHEISRKTPDSYMYMSCVRKNTWMTCNTTCIYPMSDTIRHVSDTVQHVFVMYLMIMNDIRHMCKHVCIQASGKTLHWYCFR